MGTDRKQRDMSAYYQGQDKGKAISIDPQAEGQKVAGRLK